MTTTHTMEELSNYIESLDLKSIYQRRLCKEKIFPEATIDVLRLLYLKHVVSPAQRGRLIKILTHYCFLPVSFSARARIAVPSSGYFDLYSLAAELLNKYPSEKDIFINYEPEIFPGLILKLRKYHMNIIFHSKGGIVFNISDKGVFINYKRIFSNIFRDIINIQWVQQPEVVNVAGVSRFLFKNYFVNFYEVSNLSIKTKGVTVDYDDVQFMGMFLHFNGLQGNLTLFKNGAVSIQAKSLENVRQLLLAASKFLSPLLVNGKTTFYKLLQNDNYLFAEYQAHISSTAKSTKSQVRKFLSQYVNHTHARSAIGELFLKTTGLKLSED